MNRSYLCLLVLFQITIVVKSWPDGAPCVHAAFESMNPLEAVEHQGGLQLSDPPFHIEVDRQCYWRNQPISLTLRGNSTKDKFKGFVIQPIVWKGSKYGQRIGQFMRLDDNGSWQQQCFRKKDSVTHSHDEFKTQMMLWWKNDEDEAQYVQFVATVVIHLKQFWVKSVLSPPIPPCRMERQAPEWTKPPITVPPLPNQFKMDTWRLFNHESSGTFPRSISSFPEENQGSVDKSRGEGSRFISNTIPDNRVFTVTTPVPVTFSTVRSTSRINEVSGDVPVIFTQRPSTTRMPSTTTTTQRPSTTATTQRPIVVFRPDPTPRPESRHRQKLTRIIPLPNMEPNRRPRPTTVTPPTSQLTSRQPSLVTIPPLSNQQRTIPGFRPRVSPTVTRLLQINREIASRLQQQGQAPGMQQPQFFQNQCVDLDAPGRCFGWIIYCGQSAYMETFCRRTCRFC